MRTRPEYDALHIKGAPAGWRNHRVLDEGLPGWVDKGYPVEGRP